MWWCDTCDSPGVDCECPEGEEDIIWLSLSTEPDAMDLAKEEE